MFSLLILPLGIIIGINSTALPFLLAKAGLRVDAIAGISSILNLPGVLVFVWAPLVDTRLRRRTWLALATVATSVFVCVFFPLIGTSHILLMSGLMLAGGIAASLVLATSGGLMVRTLSEPAQAKASAWSQAGLLGGGVAGGALVLSLATRLSLAATGVCVAVLVALPALLAFSIPEPPPEPSPWFRGRLPVMARETWAVLRSPRRRWSTLLLLSPLGTGAAQSLLPAIASHYGVGPAGVLWFNGVSGGVVLALGSLCGALIPSNWDRRLTYAGAGLANALASLVLLAGNKPAIYLAGTMCYLATEGLCWARFTALQVEIVGSDTHDASTVFSALNGIGTLPIVYMIKLDGVGFQKYGTHGLLWVDVAGNFTVCAVVFAVSAFCGLRLKQRSIVGALEPRHKE